MMPTHAWEAVYGAVCGNLPAGASCVISTAGKWTIENCDRTKFSPIKLKIDATYYEMPFTSYFYSNSAKMLCTVKNVTNDDRIILGVPFMTDYYQVYDLARNQMALVPNKYQTMDRLITEPRFMSKAAVVFQISIALLFVFLHFMSQQEKEKKPIKVENDTTI